MQENLNDYIHKKIFYSSFELQDLKLYEFFLWANLHAIQKKKLHEVQPYIYILLIGQLRLVPNRSSISLYFPWAQ